MMSETAERRRCPDLSLLDKKIDTLVKSHERVNVALFAEDADNEFGTAGVMTVMQKIDKHIDVMCNLALGVKKFIKWGAATLTGAAGLFAAMKAAGWW